jgi:excinuclease ABC subunit A
MRIEIQGASEHNLKDIDVQFGDGLTVVTGVSGSGKTSLVFDTLYHEARRRFLEVFALGSTNLRLAPAKVRRINGLGPAVAVGQNLLNRNPNSTLASATGLHLFLRMLYARFGQRHCPRCGTGMNVFSEDEIVEQLLHMADRQSISVSVPLLRGVRGSHRSLLQLLKRQFGSQAVRVDGQQWSSEMLDADQAHDVEVELALLSGDASVAHVREVVEAAAELGAPAVVAGSDAQTVTFGRAPVCLICGLWFSDLRPVHFGTACPHCSAEGCERCAGTGLHPQAAAVRLHSLRLPELLACSVDKVSRLFSESSVPSSAARLHGEIKRRLEALQKVGLGYITLDRSSPSLSRGEAQRVRLAVALTSRLEDMLYVLDEPTIGQHAADVARLLPVFRELHGPVVYVEHDRFAASVADQAIDLGPGAGREGGCVLFSGPPAALWEADTLLQLAAEGRASRTASTARANPHSARRSPTQSTEYRRADPRGLSHRHQRCLWLRKEHAGGRCFGGLTLWGGTRRLHRDRRTSPEGRACRSEPHRAQSPLQCCDLHQALGYLARSVRHGDGAQCVTLFLQSTGGCLPGVQGHGRNRSADALPALHLDPLRSLRGAALLRRSVGCKSDIWRSQPVHR